MDSASWWPASLPTINACLLKPLFEEALGRHRNRATQPGRPRYIQICPGDGMGSVQWGLVSGILMMVLPD